MSKPQETAIPEPERMTWTEICERYPDEWVVLVETEWLDDNNFEFGTAVVLGHAKGHNEVLKETRPLLGDVTDSGIFFTGRARARMPRFFLP